MNRDEVDVTAIRYGYFCSSRTYQFMCVFIVCPLSVPFALGYKDVLKLNSSVIAIMSN
jgi:hypothetical protein